MLKADCRDDCKDCKKYHNSSVIKCPGESTDASCGWCPKYFMSREIPEEYPIQKEKPTYTVNPQRKVYNIDFDNTLTTGEYTDVPGMNLEMVLKVRRLYIEGNIIIIWSARLWEYAPKLASWLIFHEVPYHGIILGKGGADYYIDDKAINSNDFLGEKYNENY